MSAHVMMMKGVTRIAPATPLYSSPSQTSQVMSIASANLARAPSVSSYGGGGATRVAERDQADTRQQQQLHNPGEKPCVIELEKLEETIIREMEQLKEGEIDLEKLAGLDMSVKDRLMYRSGIFKGCISNKGAFAIARHMKKGIIDIFKKQLKEVLEPNAKIAEETYSECIRRVMTEQENYYKYHQAGGDASALEMLRRRVTVAIADKNEALAELNYWTVRKSLMKAEIVNRREDPAMSTAQLTTSVDRFIRSLRRGTDVRDLEDETWHEHLDNNQELSDLNAERGREIDQSVANAGDRSSSAQEQFGISDKASEEANAFFAEVERGKRRPVKLKFVKEAQAPVVTTTRDKDGGGGDDDDPGNSPDAEGELAASSLPLIPKGDNTAEKKQERQNKATQAILREQANMV